MRERVEVTNSLVEGEKKEAFPREVFLPAMILVKRQWKNFFEEEQIILFHSLQKKEGKQSEGEILRGLTESLLNRVSWLMPPEEESKISQGLNFRGEPQPVLEGITPVPDGTGLARGRLTRLQYLLNKRSGLSGNKETLAEIATELGVTRERARQLESLAERKVVIRLMGIEVKTLTGKRALGEVLKENLAEILETVACQGKIPEYSPAPESIWEIVDFLAENEEKFLNEKLALIPLSCPYDFLFARQVLYPLFKEFGEKINLASFRRLPFIKFSSLLGKFQQQLEGEIPATFPTFRWLPEESENGKISPHRRLTPADFGEGPFATRLCNALLRSGISTTALLMRKTLRELSSIRQIGGKSLKEIFRFLQSSYPQERLTKELETFLQEV